MSFPILKDIINIESEEEVWNIGALLEKIQVLGESYAKKFQARGESPLPTPRGACLNIIKMVFLSLNTTFVHYSMDPGIIKLLKGDPRKQLTIKGS